MNLVAPYESDFDKPCHTLQDIFRLVSVMDELGADPAAVLDGSQLDQHRLTDPCIRISYNQKLAVFRNAITLSPRPDIGLLASKKAHFSDFGFMGYALMSADTFADSIELGFKYLQLASPVLQKTFTADDDVARFEGLEINDLGGLLPFCIEYWFGSIFVLCSEVIQRPLSNICIRLPYSDPGYGDKYRELFKCDIIFDSQSIQWDFSAKDLLVKVPNANPITVKLCVQSCESMLAVLESSTTLEDQVKAYLLQNPGDFPDSEKAAAHFGLSVRSMSRKLSALGCSYQGILNETRKSLSLQYLQRTSMTVEEIASLTGFSDASNFRKAFKRWTGSNPNYYRQASK